uniref:BED-type domain-containing protein n=1 Tax=Meloidogyne floridensis TaxID=298350 RepID=A0A915NLZ4_9BILA
MNILKFILIYLTLKWYSTGSQISNHSPSGSEVDHLIMDFENGGRIDHLLQNSFQQNHEAESSSTNIDYSNFHHQHRHNDPQHPSSSMLHSNFQQNQNAAQPSVYSSNIQPSYQQNESRHMLASINWRDQNGEASSIANSSYNHATSVDDVFDEIFEDGIKKYHCKEYQNNQRCKSKVIKSRGKTSNLWKHLRESHPDEYSAIKAKIAENRNNARDVRRG